MSLEELINYVTSNQFSVKFTWLEYEGIYQSHLRSLAMPEFFALGEGVTALEALTEACIRADASDIMEAPPELKSNKD